MRGGRARRRANPVVSRTIPLARPMTVRNSTSITRRGITVTHRELYDVVYTPADGSFLNVAYRINPALDIVFPWLAPIAAQFEQYRFTKLQFRYVPSCSATTVGALVMGMDYNALDAAAPDISTLTTYSGSIRSQLYTPCVFTCGGPELARFQNERYTRRGDIPTGGNAQLYDVGTFQFAVNGAAAAAQVGEIYVEYTVHLFTPQLNVLASTEAMSAECIPSGVDASNPLGTALNRTGGLELSHVSSTVLRFLRDGYWKLIAKLNGGAATPPTLAFSGCNAAVNDTALDSTGYIRYYTVLLDSMGLKDLTLTPTGGTLTAATYSLSPYFV